MCQCAGKCYGYVPRMKRIMIIHQYVWYMVYDYGQHEDLQNDDVQLSMTGPGVQVGAMSSDSQVGQA